MENAYVIQLKNRKFSELYLCFCGYAKCEPLHSYGPAVRPYYLMHLILEGKGRYIVGEERYDIQKGQGFLIEPEVLTFYQADGEEPWSYIWIGFGGSRAGEYLADIGLGNGKRIFHCTYLTELKDMLLNIMKKNTFTLENEFLRESFLYRFFSVMSRGLGIEAGTGNGTENIYVRKAIEFVQNNYFNPIHVSDMANYVGVSRGYLHTLFVRNLSQSPQEYLISYRITRGAELLSVTDLSVETVAQSCGYNDPLVFSKLFKKKMGRTPMGYRKENWENQKKEMEYNKHILEGLE